MKRTTYLFTFLLAFMVCFNSHAQEVKLSSSRNAVRKSGDVLACLTPAASLATVLILQDWQGLKQGALAGVSTVDEAGKVVYEELVPEITNEPNYEAAIASLKN